jgi:hypothetical protein
MRAVKDSLAAPLEGEVEKNEKNGMGACAPGTHALRRREARKLTSLCARRGPTIKRWSLDARSRDYASLLAENG